MLCSPLAISSAAKGEDRRKVPDRSFLSSWIRLSHVCTKIRRSIVEMITYRLKDMDFDMFSIDLKTRGSTCVIKDLKVRRFLCLSTDQNVRNLTRVSTYLMERTFIYLSTGQKVKCLRYF